MGRVVLPGDVFGQSRHGWGRTQGRVIVFADLTERKRVEAAVVRAGQMEQRLEGARLTVREVAHLSTITSRWRSAR